MKHLGFLPEKAGSSEKETEIYKTTLIKTNIYEKENLCGIKYCPCYYICWL